MDCGLEGIMKQNAPWTGIDSELELVFFSQGN